MVKDFVKYLLVLPLNSWQLKTNYYQNSFDYAGAKVWNALRDDLKGEKSIGAFKNKLESVDLSIDFKLYTVIKRFALFCS